MRLDQKFDPKEAFALEEWNILKTTAKLTDSTEVLAAMKCATARAVDWCDGVKDSIRRLHAIEHEHEMELRYTQMRELADVGRTLHAVQGAIAAMLSEGKITQEQSEEIYRRAANR